MIEKYREYIGKNIIVRLDDGKEFKGILQYIVEPQDEDEEEMILIGEKLALLTKDIREIKISD